MKLDFVSPCGGVGIIRFFAAKEILVLRDGTVSINGNGNIIY